MTHSTQVVSSYRGMFELATSVVAASTAPSETERLARKLCHRLGPIIDDPIAPSALLKHARSLFMQLMNLMDAERERPDEKGTFILALDCPHLPCIPKHEPPIPSLELSGTYRHSEDRQHVS